MSSTASARIILFIAFAVGLVAVAWVGAGFVGSNTVALAMSVLIGAVYLAGALEIRRFRAGTAAFAAALADVPQPLASLDAWLGRVPAELRPAVRLRLDGERSALPGLALTPYLVGLLVMLGMLGTFLGMVVTFSGAVSALEVAADLPAIRAVLAAPIKGLALAFGTSVAGVAASAMLGLMVAISRRERVAVGRELDAQIATGLRPFSLAQQRQETFHALQAQARALPAVAEQLQALMAQVERRDELLNTQLLQRQGQFHEDVSQSYTALARSVEQSLNASLAASASLAGESIRPVVASAMTALAEESRLAHERVGAVVQAQLGGLADRFGATAATVVDGWHTALQAQAHGGEQLLAGLDHALAGFSGDFARQAATLLAGVDAAAARTHAEQAQAAQQAQATWTQALATLAAKLQCEWQRAGEQALAQQQAICTTLEQTATAMAERLGAQAGDTGERIARLLAQSEELVRARAASEAHWVARQGEHMDRLAALWRSELAALHAAETGRGEAVIAGLEHLRADAAARDAAVADRLDRLCADAAARGDAAAARLEQLRVDEAARGEAAVARLGELQAALASHLATLGAALETPLNRLLCTAAEVPQAAAAVIAQLRTEMSHLGARDNLALEERATLMANIGALLQSVHQATGEQRAAIESLVASATTVLDQVGRQFAATLGAQTERTEEAAAQVAGSALELASLGEAFRHGVELFSATNEHLVAGLQQTQAAISQSMARSDEQLAYYVAQAREVIDLSISAQQGIVDDLRRLHDGQPAAAGDAT